MRRVYRFPLKGSYYYAARAAFEAGLLKTGSALEIVTEPDNPHDANALQIWLVPDKNADRRLLGYVPRQLARLWRPLFAGKPDYRLHIDRLGLQGKWLNIRCEIALQLNWQQRLLTHLWLWWLKWRRATVHFHRQP